MSYIFYQILMFNAREICYFLRNLHMKKLENNKEPKIFDPFIMIAIID